MTNTSCKRCGELETEAHVLLQCLFAAKVWDLILALCKPVVSINSTHLLLQLCSKMVKLPPTGLNAPLLPWVLWNLWTSRNQLFFEDKKFIEQEVVAKAVRDARAWANAQLPHKLQVPPHTLMPTCRSRALPQPSTVRCYSDVACQESSGNSGFGWIFKTLAGADVSFGTSPQRFVASAIAAEALAIKSALLDAAYARYRDLEVFSDCKGLVSLIDSNDTSATLKSLLYDISMLSQTF